MNLIQQTEERAGRIEIRLAQIDTELTQLCLRPAPGLSPESTEARVRDLHTERDALDTELGAIRRDLATPRVPLQMPRLIRPDTPAEEKSCQRPRPALLDESTKKAGTSRHVPAQAYDKDGSL